MPSPNPRDLTWLAAAAFALLCLPFIRARAYSANDLSRLAAVESLVARGTWAINGSPFGTIDKIKVGELYYSDKPPMLALAGAGVYLVLHRAFGLTLQPQGCAPGLEPSGCRAVLEPATADWAYVLLTLSLVTAAGALGVGLAYRFARRHDLPNWFSFSFALSLGLGTGLFPYSTAFANHVPAAAAAMGALYLLVARPASDRAALFWAGLLVTLSATLDLSAGVFLVALAGLAVWRTRREAAWFALGGLGPGLLAMWINFQIIGSPLPPQTYTAGYDFPGAQLHAGFSGFRAAADPARYAFDLLIGRHGLLAFFPIIAVYLAAAGRALLAPNRQLRGAAGLIGAASLAYFLYFVFSTDNFGGFAYSPRWLLLPVPMLALFALADDWLIRGTARLAFLAGLAAFSIWNGYQGALDVWRPAWPAVRLELAPAAPGADASVSGFGNIFQVPDRLRPGLSPNGLTARNFDARQGLVVPAGPAWWFIAGETPLAPELAEALSLPSGGEVAVHADLAGRARAWLAGFDVELYDHPAHIPDDSAPLQSVRLPVTLGGEVTLLGYRLSRTGDALTLITVWQVERRPPHTDRRSQFFHLMSQDGRNVRQSDGLAADLRELQPGDWLLQVQRLSLAELPPRAYWMQIGLYDPIAGDRLVTPDFHHRLLLPPLDLAAP